MKNLFISSAVCLLLLNCFVSKAQSFTVINDTIHVTATPGRYFDSIVTGSSAVAYSWQAIACNFPADWFSSDGTSFCDDILCRSIYTVTPSSYIDTTSHYTIGDTGVLVLALDFTDTLPGCYYISVRLHNIANYSDSVTETWSICNPGVATGVRVINNPGNIRVYPNPANDELHISSDMSIAHAEIYDLLGKKLKVAVCISGSADIMLNDLEPGIYFIRLTDDQGAMIRTLKFVKQ